MIIKSLTDVTKLKKALEDTGEGVWVDSNLLYGIPVITDFQGVIISENHGTYLSRDRISQCDLYKKRKAINKALRDKKFVSKTEVCKIIRQGYA